MSATPGDIAKYTKDGEIVTYQDSVLKLANPQARDLGIIDTFFRYAADADAMLTEKSLATGTGTGVHETIEVEERLGIGSDIAVTPQVPSFQIVDETRTLDLPARTLSVAFDMTAGADRYSVEVAA